MGESSARFHARFTWIIGEIWRLGAETRICDLWLGFPQANKPSIGVAQ